MPRITQFLDEKGYGADDHDKIEALQRRTTGVYLKDAVYAANDGLVTTFAVIAGAVGAVLSMRVVIIIGLASLLADGLSMAIGNFLGSRSERHWQEQQRSIESWEIDHIPEVEEEEIRTIYKRKGFEGDLLEKVVETIKQNKEVWLDEMLVAEHGVAPSALGATTPMRHGLVTFVSFVLAGIVPIVPFLVLTTAGTPFLWAGIFTGLGLFVVGASRTFFTARPWWRGGLEMLVLGSIAALVAFLVGDISAGFIE